MQGQRHVADLVEEQRAALGHLQLAWPALALGTGEGPRGGTEEFGLQQAFRDRRGVHADEGLVRPRRSAVDGVGEQFLAGAGLAEQQHRRFAGRATTGAALDFQAGRTGADEVAEAVLGLARLQLRAGRGQFALHAQVAGHQRRQRTQFVEQGEADGADHFAGVVVDRQAHHHQRVLRAVHHVQQDRLAAAYHFAQQATGDHAFAGPADGLRRVGEAETLGVALVDPDDAGLAVDDHRAFAGAFDDLEQRTDRLLAHALVILEAVGVVHRRLLRRTRHCSREAARGEGSGFLDGQRGGAFPLRLGGGRADLEDQ